MRCPEAKVLVRPLAPGLAPNDEPALCPQPVVAQSFATGLEAGTRTAIKAIKSRGYEGRKSPLFGAHLGRCRHSKVFLVKIASPSK